MIGGSSPPTSDGRKGGRDRFNEFVARHEIAWELTMAALAVVFVVLGFLPEEGASVELAAAEWILTVLFAAEFGARFGASHDRRRYLVGHWIDLVALVPSIRGLRVLRLVRLLRLVRVFASVARALTSVERLGRHRGLIWLLVAWAAVMILSSIGLYAAEHGANSAVNEPLDALWWGIVTMTTVGYGDVYPITPEGRLAASVLMLLGIALFSAVTATITSFLLESRGAAENPLDVLERLGRLRDSGYVTDEQFETARDALLSNPHQLDGGAGSRG